MPIDQRQMAKNLEFVQNLQFEVNQTQEAELALQDAMGAHPKMLSQNARETIERTAKENYAERMIQQTVSKDTNIELARIMHQDNTGIVPMKVLQERQRERERIEMQQLTIYNKEMKQTIEEAHKEKVALRKEISILKEKNIKLQNERTEHIRARAAAKHKFETEKQDRERIADAKRDLEERFGELQERHEELETKHRAFVARVKTDLKERRLAERKRFWNWLARAFRRVRMGEKYRDDEEEENEEGALS